jgi:hypothetical protein
MHKHGTRGGTSTHSNLSSLSDAGPRVHTIFVFHVVGGVLMVLVGIVGALWRRKRAKMAVSSVILVL